MQPNKGKLARKLTIVICCKIALIFVIFLAFFGPETKRDQTPEAVSAGILHPHSQLNTKGQEQ